MTSYTETRIPTTSNDSSWGHQNDPSERDHKVRTIEQLDVLRVSELPNRTAPKQRVQWWNRTPNQHRTWPLRAFSDHRLWPRQLIPKPYPNLIKTRAPSSIMGDYWAQLLTELVASDRHRGGRCQPSLIYLSLFCLFAFFSYCLLQSCTSQLSQTYYYILFLCASLNQ